MDAIASFFKLNDRGTNVGTEAKAGLTTFVVMAYIIFVNPTILTAGFKDADPAFTFPAIAAATALIAGLMTIAMGVFANYPFALAAGLGINAIVAFTLTAKGLSPAGAMGVIVIEGVLVTILVLAGLREAIMNAVPLALKRAIGVGIGLFILFIGFANGGFIKAGSGTLVTVQFPTTTDQFVFIAGLAITIVLWARKVPAAILLSIFLTTILALLVGSAKLPDTFTATPDFSTLGKFDLTQVWSLGPLVAILTIFAIMLTDFFDTMGTVTGVAAEAGLANEDGSVPNVNRVLLVDSVAAAVGGAAGTSSNTTYIESAAGVAEGGRTGLTSVVTGVLFLLAVFLTPIAGIVPAVATAQGVEAVDRHVEQQHMIHLLAKPAEVRREEKIGVNAGERADRVGAQRAPDATNAREIAPVLHDGVDAPGGLCPLDKIARVRERLRHGFFAQDMAARRQTCRDDVITGRRHDDVEDEIGAAPGDQRMNVARDEGVFQREFFGAPFGAFNIQVGEADDAQIGDLCGRLQPDPAHCATADEGGLQLHRRFLSRACPARRTTVNVYDPSGDLPPCQPGSRASKTRPAGPAPPGPRRTPPEDAAKP